MNTIALDAMGSDLAPRPEIEGAIQASREYGVKILVVGQPAALKAELGRHARRGANIEIAPASELIAMKDVPAKVVITQKVAPQSS